MLERADTETLVIGSPEQTKTSSDGPTPWLEEAACTALTPSPCPQQHLASTSTHRPSTPFTRGRSCYCYPILQMKELRPKGSVMSSSLSPRELVVWSGPPPLTSWPRPRWSLRLELCPQSHSSGRPRSLASSCPEARAETAAQVPVCRAWRRPWSPRDPLRKARGLGQLDLGVDGGQGPGEMGTCRGRQGGEAWYVTSQPCHTWLVSVNE